MIKIDKFPTLLAAHQADVRGPPVGCGPQVENRCSRGRDYLRWVEVGRFKLQRNCEDETAIAHNYPVPTLFPYPVNSKTPES